MRPRRAGVGGLGAGALDVPEILDVLEALPAQRLVEAGQADCGRAHVRAAPAAAQIQAHAGDRDGRPLDLRSHHVPVYGQSDRAHAGPEATGPPDARRAVRAAAGVRGP